MVTPSIPRIVFAQPSQDNTLSWLQVPIKEPTARFA